MPKTATCVVDSLEGSKPYEITSKTLGGDLLQMVFNDHQMSASSFFNLQYEDKKGNPGFIKPDKKVLSHDLKKVAKGEPHNFSFASQYFPESVADEMKQPSQRRYLWLQVRKGIVDGDIYSPPELCVLFAAQSMQATHGDYDADKHAGVIKATQELPARVLDQHKLTEEKWEGRIQNAWSGLAGTDKNQAILDFLTIAQDLEQYGVTYFEIHNKKGTKLWLGVHNLGMDIYEFHNKVTPRLGFPWVEVRNIAYNEKQFVIRMTDSKVPDFKFYSRNYKMNKRILALCVGNYQLYVERRSNAADAMMDEPEEDRANVEAKIRRTKEQLLAIRADLDSVKDETKLTAEDRYVEEARAQGMDKFKTMKKAQGGDARRRIEEFEDLEDAEC